MYGHPSQIVKDRLDRATVGEFFRYTILSRGILRVIAEIRYGFKMVNCNYNSEIEKYFANNFDN